MARARGPSTPVLILLFRLSSSTPIRGSDAFRGTSALSVSLVFCRRNVCLDTLQTVSIRLSGAQSP